MKSFHILLVITLIFIPPVHAKTWPGFEKGMGIGGWLTNYKRFNVLPDNRRMQLTIGDYEHFDTYITEQDVKRISSWGFDHIRVGFDQIVLEEAPFRYRERTMHKLEEMARWCEKYKLNLVLNLHKAIGNYCDIKEEVGLMDDSLLQERFISLWVEIERRFHNQPAIAFELLNEVRDVNPDIWNNLAERTIAALRRQNKTRVIVVGPTCWNNPPALKNMRVYDDPNIVYTFHCYEPFEFTHQRGVLQSGPLYYNREMPYPCDDINRYRDYQKVVNGNSNAYVGMKKIDKELLRGILGPAFDFMNRHPDKILWAGEFGTIRHAKIEWREAYMNDLISLLKEHGIPYCVWNYLSTPNDGNRFSLVDDETREMLSPKLKKICLGKVK